MAEVAAATAIIGTGVSIYGQIKEGEERARAYEMDAELRNMQANEILRRQRINERIIMSEARELQGEQVASYAAAGVDVGAGAPLMMAERTLQKARERILMEFQEARYTAENIKRGHSNSV